MSERDHAKSPKSPEKREFRMKDSKLSLRVSLGRPFAVHVRKMDPIQKESANWKFVKPLIPVITGAEHWSRSGTRHAAMSETKEEQRRHENNAHNKNHLQRYSLFIVVVIVKV